MSKVVSSIPALYTGWTFYTFICNVYLKRPKIDDKRGRGRPIKQNRIRGFVANCNSDIQNFLKFRGLTNPPVNVVFVLNIKQFSFINAPF